jgi:hypothetical protein
MKSVHAAVTALLALTVWASQQGYGPGTGDGKGESLVVGPAPSAEPAASEAAVTRILPVVDPLFQFGDGGGAGQPPSQDPFDPSGDPFDLSDPQPSAAGAAAAEEQGARRPEGSQQKKPKKGSQAAGGPGAAGGGGKLGGPGAAGGGGALGGAGAWNSGHPAGVVPGGGAGAWNSGHPAGVVPGGGAGGGYGGVVAPKALSSRSSGDTTTERSQFERQLLKLLEESFEADLQADSAGQLADSLQQNLGVPVMIRDEPQLEGVDYEGATAAVPAGLPLGVALKTALRPLRLRPIVRDDAIVFVPDTAALARAGLETAHYVNLDDDFMQRVSDALRKPHNLSFTQIPLEDVLLQLSEETELSFQINERALEDLGLSVDLPISVRSKDAPLQEGLRMILDPVELTLRPRDGYIEVTTREEAEEPENQVLRLYWLDGTGFRSGDAALRVIETLINPDIWETVGGPATMSYLDNSAGDRLGLAFSTTFETHQQIERLLATLRKKLVDPQPQVETGRQKTPGMGGMGGGGTM